MVFICQPLGAITRRMHEKVFFLTTGSHRAQDASNLFVYFQPLGAIKRRMQATVRFFTAGKPCKVRDNMGSVPLKNMALTQFVEDRISTLTMRSPEDKDALHDHALGHTQGI